ncbi:MAG: alkaline phosphatase family protein [Armatimonadia bacterium]
MRSSPFCSRKELLRTPKPVWIIGLDGMDPELLQHWAAAGLLPNLATCMASGVSGRLRSTYNQLTASAWATAATGAQPGGHGVYNFQERVPGEYRLALPTAADRKLPAVWEIASAAGLQSTVARVPLSYPLRPFNGLGVVDWLAPSPESPGFAHPADLGAQLVERFGREFWLEGEGGCGLHCDPHDRDSVLRQLHSDTERTCRLFSHLHALQPADLFFGVIREADIGGHLLWPHHAACDRHSRDSDPLLSVYQHIDRCLGDLLDEVGTDVNLLFLSDHGMGASPLGPSCVRPLLQAAGLMVAQGTPMPPLPSRMKAAVCKHIPWDLRRRLRPLSSSARSQGFTALHLAGIDFSQSLAFTYLAMMTGEIWLNLKGRDPLGMVEPGPQQEALEEEITRLFMSATDPVSGVPAVTEVRRGPELFAGPNVGIFADLHLGFVEEPRISGLSTLLPDGSRVTVNIAPDSPLLWLGSHRPHGIFVACGPDIIPTDIPVEGTLADIAPTALALLGVPIPPHMDGHVLEHILAPRIRPHVREYEIAAACDSIQPDYAPEDLERIEARLGALGYL